MNDGRVVCGAAADTLVEPDRKDRDLVLFDAVLVPGVLICERLRNFDEELSHGVHDVVLPHLLEVDQHHARVVVDVAVEFKLTVYGLVLRHGCYPFAGDVCVPEVREAVAHDGVHVEVYNLVQLRE